MRILLLFIPFLIAAQTAPDVRTLCDSGCTYTDPATAFSTIATDRAATCKDYILNVDSTKSYTGSYRLPLTGTDTCKKYIIVRTSRYAELPVGRVDRATYSSMMPNFIVGGDGYALRFGNVVDGGAHYWMFDGIRCTTNGAIGANYSCFDAEVDTGNGSVVIRDYTKAASHIKLNRVITYNSDSNRFFQRAVFLNCRNCSVTNSDLSSAGVGDEGQAIGSLFCEDCEVRNNFLSATGEDFIIGGSATQYSTVYGFSPYNLRILGNKMWWKPEWKTDTTCGGSPVVCTPVSLATLNTTPLVPCYPGEFAKTTTGTPPWAKCNADGAAWTDNQAEPESATIPKLFKNHVDIKVGRRVLMRGNDTRYGWDDQFRNRFFGQQGQCVIMNSSITDNVWNLTFEGNRCSETVTMANHGISEAWNPTFRQNQAWNMARPHTMYPMPHSTRSIMGFSASTNLQVVNNSLHLYSNDATPISENAATYISITDERPQVTNNGGKGTIIFGDNAWAGPSGTTSLMLGGSSFSSPGTWCFLVVTSNDPYSGWIMPGTYLSWSGQLFAGSLTNLGGIRPLVGSGCNISSSQPVFPTGTLTAAAATDLFTAPATGNMLQVSGAWNNTGANGRTPGADNSFVAAMTAEALTGGMNPYLDFGVNSITTTTASSGTITVFYSPVQGQSCTARASSVQNFASTVGTATYPATGKAVITGAGSGAIRWVEVQCGNVYQSYSVLMP